MFVKKVILINVLLYNLSYVLYLFNENKVCPKDKSSRSEEDILLDKSKPSTDLIFIDGVVETINDDCISNKLEDGTLLFKNDYMFTNQDFIKEQVDKSKKIYRRRINLDNLIK